jgi:hypothetical protein
MSTTDIVAPRDLLGDTGIGYIYMYSLRFGPWARMSGPSTLVHAPLEL